MKRFLAFFLIGLMGLSAAYLNMSCSPSKNPSAPGLQSPVLTLVGDNPSFTPTFTFTPTQTQTTTPTATSTRTQTPIPTATLTGFSGPGGLAVDNLGALYVADTGNNLVKKYVNGQIDSSWGSHGDGRTAFTGPQGLAVDSAYNLYAVGSGTNAVVQFDSNGHFKAQWTTGNGSFSGPQGVAVDQSNHVYVSDTGNDRIVELDSTGTPVGSFGTGGVVSLSTAVYGIAVDGNGHVAVACGDNQVRLFDATGAPLASNPNIPGFSSPRGLAFDSLNNLFVADSGNRSIEEFNSLGLNQPPQIFNNGGNMLSPQGVAVDLNGIIYVADSGRNNVVVFTP